MRIICLAILVASHVIASAQARLILNDNIYMVMSNNVYLVVDNASTSAITTAGTGGNIVSEAEGNYVKWSIGNSVASYVIPFTTSDGNKIPLTYTTTNGGLGNGTVSFSTYKSATWNNYDYRPAAVTNMTNMGVTNASPFVIDRFWQTATAGYTTLPAGNISFTYVDAEHSAAGNTITESELRVERYEPISDNWEYYAPGGTINTTLNTLSAVPFTSASFMTNWTMIDQTAHLLPLEVIAFEGACDDAAVTLTWTTASEQMTDHFTIMSSADGIHFESLMEVQAAGTSTESLAYFVQLTMGTGPYYQLHCVDQDGTKHIFNTIFLPCAIPSDVTLFANDAGYHQLSLRSTGWASDQLQVIVFDMCGHVCYQSTVELCNGAMALDMHGLTWGNGIYVVQLTDMQGQQMVTRVLLSD